MFNQANFLQSLGWAVLNSLWQLSLLWLLYQLITSLAGKQGAAFRSRLAAWMLISGFVWFLYTFITALQQEEVISYYISLAYSDQVVLNSWLSRILPFTSVAYLLLLLIPLFRFIRNYRYVQVIRQYGLSRPSAEWKLFINRIASQMGIRQPVQIWLSDWVNSPVTIGFLKPVILVPMAAINQLSTQQMEAVLLHELAHIRRHDYLMNLVLNFIRTILYFNPFARAFVKIVESEREKNCDELVLQFQYTGFDYASALLSLEKLSQTQQFLVLGAAGQGPQLLNRIETILGVQTKKQFSIRQLSGLVTAVCYILVLQTFFFLGRSITLKAKTTDTGIASHSFSGMSAQQKDRLASNHSGAGYTLTATAHNSNDFRTPEPESLPIIASMEGNPALRQVKYVPNDIELGEVQQPEKEVVQEAVASSRKVLENSQWTAIEKNLADVFSEKEKQDLKKAFRDEMNKFNWKQWEQKLMQAYDQVNWDMVNTQLNDALGKMRADSLVKVYNDALVNISRAQQELNRLQVNGIPDTDITLRALTNKQRQLRQEVERLKQSSRPRKIIQL